jgi:hypothetical protein
MIREILSLNFRTLTEINLSSKMIERMDRFAKIIYPIFRAPFVK